MNVNIQHQLDSLINLIRKQVPRSSFEILFYAEVEDGVSSADLFFTQNDSGVVYFKFGNQALHDSLRVLRKNWKNDTHKEPWQALTFYFKESKFNFDFTYPSELNPNEDLHERRPRVLEKYFRNREIIWKS